MLAPVGVTVFVFNFLVDLIGAPTRNTLFFFLRADEHTIWVEWLLKLAGIAAVATIITGLGWVSQKFIGKLFVTMLERAIESLPVVRSVYNTVKQIRDTFIQQDRSSFQQCVLIEFPRRDTWVLGFSTGPGARETCEATGQALVHVFVPTTPNPTSGFMIMVPRSDVKMLTMSVSDGMKLIISGGAVLPKAQAPFPTTVPPSPVDGPASVPPFASGS